MLVITVPASEGIEFFNERTSEFGYIDGCPEQTLKLEHSLVSISKWEAKHHRPFLDPNDEKTNEDMIDYIKCMTITQGVPSTVYDHLTEENIAAIKDYIDNPMTATTFGKTNGKPNKEIITSEIIYYWMVSYSIPVEFERWHINRLITLIRVLDIKNQPEKKQSTRDIMNSNAALNAKRRAMLKSKG